MTTMTPSDKVSELNVRTLLTAHHYFIPYYQRDYAWDRPEVEQLIQDIRDSWLRSEKGAMHTYYIGTLVVDATKTDEGHRVYETIDGQQRVTTLHLIMSALRELIQPDPFPGYSLNLGFACRPRATHTLEAIAQKNVAALKRDANATHAHLGILKAYEHALAFFKKQGKFEEGQLGAFAAYMLDHVKLIRVNVPKDTDLNRYFETMNSRGEQLEKHEILKARLMAQLDSGKKEQNTFKKIWEACADMSRYVQMGFGTTERTALWGTDWNDLTQITGFEPVTRALGAPPDQADGDGRSTAQSESAQQAGMTLEAMIKTFAPEKEDTNNRGNDSPDRFQSPIDFPNFLLQVLRLHWHHHKAGYGEADAKDVVLDDKQLIQEFTRILLHETIPNRPKRIKNFAFDLLWLRWKMDSYVLKRDYSGNRPSWSLLMLRNSKNDKQNQVRHTHPWKDEEDEHVYVDLKPLILVQSMFHVTYPSNTYKHWLTGALNHIYQGRYANSLTYADYLSYLEGMARAFMFDQYLNPQTKGGDTFHSIVFRSTTTGPERAKETNWRLLDRGVGVPHFALNYLDYLLWKGAVAPEGTSDHALSKAEVADFEFIYRNSVEHFYPQDPHDNQYLGGSKEVHDANIHRLGNLCLIGHSDNSRLNNHLPDEKDGFFSRIENPSLKLRLMKKSAKEWKTTLVMDDHEAVVIKVMEKELMQHITALAVSSESQGPPLSVSTVVKKKRGRKQGAKNKPKNKT